MSNREIDTTWISDVTERHLQLVRDVAEKREDDKTCHETRQTTR